MQLTSPSARQSILVRYGNFLFRARDVVFPIVLFSILALFRPEYPLASSAYDAWLDVVGIVLASLGQLLRAAVVGYAYIVRGGRNKRFYADNLVTEGFFAHARNPLYLGNLLILLGLFVIWNSTWVYLIGVPFFLLGYVAIVAAEEKFLREKFGAEYEEYCARVNRWIPDLRGISTTIGGMRFNWRRVILKEYGSAIYWMAGAVVLLAFDSRASDRTHRAAVVLWLLIPLALAWGAARWAKKTKRLRESAA